MEGRTATLKGKVGDGPSIRLTANRGSVSVRKEGTSASEIPAPPSGEDAETAQGLERQRSQDVVVSSASDCPDRPVTGRSFSRQRSQFLRPPGLRRGPRAPAPRVPSHRHAARRAPHDLHDSLRAGRTAPRQTGGHVEPQAAARPGCGRMGRAHRTGRALGELRDAGGHAAGSRNRRGGVRAGRGELDRRPGPGEPPGARPGDVHDRGSGGHHAELCDQRTGGAGLRLADRDGGGGRARGAAGAGAAVAAGAAARGTSAAAGQPRVAARSRGHPGPLVDRDFRRGAELRDVQLLDVRLRVPHALSRALGGRGGFLVGNRIGSRRNSRRAGGGLFRRSRQPHAAVRGRGPGGGAAGLCGDPPARRAAPRWPCLC